MRGLWCVFAVLALVVSDLSDAKVFESSEKRAVPASAADYGSLYMIESRSTEVKPIIIALAYQRELSNPYLDVNGVNLQAGYALSRHVMFGAQFSRYFATNSTLTFEVESRLKTREITQSVKQPHLSGYGVVGLTPLAGQLNFFSRKAIPFDLVVTVGGGTVRYLGEGYSPAAMWSVSPQVMATANVGIQVSFGQELEAPFSNNALSRLNGKVGTVVRF